MASTSTPHVRTNNIVAQVPAVVPQPKLVGIVLAAGRASRFGSDKRLVPYDDHHTLLSRSVALIEEFCAHVFVVTRPGDEALKDLLGIFTNNQQVEQFIADDALHGMGASLANGIARAVAFEQQQDQPFDGVLVMLADMPYVREVTIKRLIENFSPDKIAIPCYLQAYKEKKWGNPVLFSRKWFTALQGLHGDRGAKSLLKANPCARVEVVVDDPGILRDIDTPEDLQNS
jgi:molybdenum cofactor cytidylyltransferase